MKRFFVKNIQDNAAYPDEEEMHHLTHVLRAKEGEDVEITDGSGHLFAAKVKLLSKKQAFFQIIDLLEKQPQPQSPLWLAVAPTKNMDRIEWLLEKAVELGVRHFFLIQTKRTERDKVNIERLRKIALSAMKQCGSLWLPAVHELQSLPSFLKSTLPQYRFIAHCMEEGDKIHLADVLVKNAETLVLIGPEGDFSSDEVQAALSAGCKAVSLGDTRLRVETAALFATVLMAEKNRQ